MPEAEPVDALLFRGLQGLCTNCANFEMCAYRKASVKIIIQCELYEMDTERATGQAERILKGLCMNCGNTDTCDLPGRRFGVWHCEEYR